MPAAVPLNPPGLEEIARQGGMTLRGRAWSPCPVCGAVRRGHGDRRGPISFQGGGWRCWAGSCGAHGDGLGLLAALRYGALPPQGDARWAALWQEVQSASGLPQMARRGPLAASVAPAPDYPPLAEVQALWASCVPLDAPEAAASVGFRWLEGRRGLSPERIGQLQLARVLPVSADWPAWLPTLGLPRPAWLSLYRLAVPLYDAIGQMRSLRFRLVDRRQGPEGWGLPPGCALDGRGRLVRGEQALPKSLSARGTTRGLVMADPVALGLLQGRRVDPYGVAFDGWVVITEGEPDMWAISTTAERFGEVRERRQTFAAFSVESGSWTPEVAARLPSDAHVRIWTDHDEAGERYAARIRETLPTGMDVQRVDRPSTWKDG